MACSLQIHLLGIIGFSFVDNITPSSADMAAASEDAAYAADNDNDHIPAMPCIKRKKPRHRTKNNVSSLHGLFDAAVARPVGRRELEQQSNAQEARDKEWNRLRDRKVWDETFIRHWHDVAREAKRAGKEVNFGFCLAFVLKKAPNCLMDMH